MRMLKALVATADDDWRAIFANALLERACDVHTTSDGMEAIDLMRKHGYHILVIDEALGQMDQIEFVFNVCDIASNIPVTIVTGAAVQKREDVWQRCGVFFAGTRSAAARKIGEAVEAARSRATDSRQASRTA